MKDLTPQQMLEAIDRALAEAAGIAARRRQRTEREARSLAENAAPFDCDSADREP